jgi:DNA-binding response OmpR family regulator
MRALIIDDEALIRRLVVRQVKALGWEAVEVSSLAEALRRFQEGYFDAALVDVNLGPDDGIALAVTLRDLDAHLNVVVMSGDPANEDKARKAGLGRILAKPFTLEELQRRLEVH